MDNNQEKLKPPIFIGGIPKSGTSLIRTLVGLHPSIYGGDGFETNWFSDDFLNNWKNPNSKKQEWLRKWHNVKIEEYHIIKNNSSSGVNYFNNFMNYCTIRGKKYRWIEKSTDNLSNYDMIDNHWSNFIFINCLRDYKDIYASWKSKSTGTLMNYDVYQFVDRVKKSYTSILGSTFKGNSNYIEIKYEDIVTNTEINLKKIINFIDEKWIDGLHDFRGNPKELKKVKKIIQSKGSKTSESLSKPIFTTSINQWHNILNNVEIDVINNELGDLYLTFLNK